MSTPSSIRGSNLIDYNSNKFYGMACLRDEAREILHNISFAPYKCSVSTTMMSFTSGVGLRVLVAIQYNEDSPEEVKKIQETITETYFRDLAEKTFTAKGYPIHEEDKDKLTIELKPQKPLRMVLH